MARPEVELVENAHRAAQARLALTGAIIAREEWQTVNPTRPTVTAAGWLRRITRLILGMRPWSRELSVSYYRLARALESGHTYPDLGGGRAATLDELRDDFVMQLERVLLMDYGETDNPDLAGFSEDADAELTPANELEEAIAEWTSDMGPDGDVRTDDFDWADDKIQSDDDVRDWFGDLLDQAGPGGLEDELRRLERQGDADGIAEAIAEAHETAGNKAAAVADKAGTDAGRELLRDARTRDRRVQAVARGTRSNPCGFCAMLASRGFVYTNQRRAMNRLTANGIERYHPNCHCYPIIRWTTETQLPQRNAELQQLWEDEIWKKGYRGREARKQWRRIINRRNRELSQEDTDG